MHASAARKAQSKIGVAMNMAVSWNAYLAHQCRATQGTDPKGGSFPLFLDRNACAAKRRAISSVMFGVERMWPRHRIEAAAARA